MVWGIIGAIDEEVRLIKENMEVLEEKKVYGSIFYRGKLYNQDVVLVCCSIGKVNAASCAGIILREFNADLVINIGIAGAAAKNLEVLDVVISKEAVFHDIFSGFMDKYYPNTSVFKADERLIKLASEVCDEMENKNFKYMVGRIATGDVFVDNMTTKNRIIELCDPACLEMEGAAIAQLAYMNDKPFLIIRSMSDNADENAEKTYDDLINLAAHNSATIVMNMIKKGL